MACTLLLALALLAVAARVDHSRALLTVDEPISRWVIAHRTATLDAFFRHVSLLGSTSVVLTGGAVLALLALPRCRIASLFIIVATLLRPAFEYTLKLSVDRTRPQLSQLIPGVGPSFPSGHVMAACVLWCMVPLVLSLYAPSRRLWTAVASTSVLIIVLIASSRVYLGVHWPTDVVGGFIAGALLIAALDHAFRAAHGYRACDLEINSARQE